MRNRVSSFIVMGALSLLAISPVSRAQDNPPPPSQQQDQSGPNGQRPQPQAGFHLIPGFAVQRLQMTDEQVQKVKELEEKVKAELAKILTPEQMKILNEARPPRGPGGPDGQNGQGRQSGQDNQNGQGNGPQRNNRPPRQQD